jgi:hypothetical protein
MPVLPNYGSLYSNKFMYTITWKKYLPVIRLLLKKSALAEQKMTLNRTDFERTSRIRKPVCSFDIEVINGRLNRLNPAAQVKSLMEVLTQDEATNQLLRKKHYAISLSSDFQLNIKNNTPVEEPVPVVEEPIQPEPVAE